MTITFESRSEPAAHADRPVPEPDLPAGYALLVAQEFTSEDVTGVALVYRRGVSTITAASVIDGAESDRSEHGSAIDLGNETGYFDRPGSTGRIRWDCGGRERIVSGDVSKATLRSVAASVECQ